MVFEVPGASKMIPRGPRGAQNGARQGPKPKKTDDVCSDTFWPESCCPAAVIFACSSIFGGLFGVSRGRPANFGALPELRKAPKTCPEPCLGPLWAPGGVPGSIFASFGLPFEQLSFDFGSISGLPGLHKNTKTTRILDTRDRFGLHLVSLLARFSFNVR